MAGKVNKTTEPPQIAQVTFVVAGGGLDTRIDNPHGIPDEVLAAGLRALADQIQGKTDRSAGCWGS